MNEEQSPPSPPQTSSPVPETIIKWSKKKKRKRAQITRPYVSPAEDSETIGSEHEDPILRIDSSPDDSPVNSPSHSTKSLPVTLATRKKPRSKKRHSTSEDDSEPKKPRIRRKIEELKAHETWHCYNPGCSKLYRKSSYASIRRHEAECKMNPDFSEPEPMEPLSEHEEEKPPTPPPKSPTPPPRIPTPVKKPKRKRRIPKSELSTSKSSRVTKCVACIGTCTCTLTISTTSAFSSTKHLNSISVTSQQQRTESQMMFSLNTRDAAVLASPSLSTPPIMRPALLSHYQPQTSMTTFSHSHPLYQHAQHTQLPSSIFPSTSLFSNTTPLLASSIITLPPPSQPSYFHTSMLNYQPYSPTDVSYVPSTTFATANPYLAQQLQQQQMQQQRLQQQQMQQIERVRLELGPQLHRHG